MRQAPMPLRSPRRTALALAIAGAVAVALPLLTLGLSASPAQAQSLAELPMTTMPQAPSADMNVVNPAVARVQALQQAQQQNRTQGQALAQAQQQPSRAVGKGTPPAPALTPSSGPTGNPAAMAALEQSVGAQRPPMNTPAASNGQGYTVPPAGQGIFEGSSQTLREMSYLNAEIDLANKRAAYEDALAKQEEARAKRKAQPEVMAAAMAKTAGLAAPAGAPGAPAAAAPVEPIVNSVYGYGDSAYAEIVLGSNKVLAQKGTVLINGDKVLAINANGVQVQGKKGRRSYPVRGSASQ